MLAYKQSSCQFQNTILLGNKAALYGGAVAVVEGSFCSLTASYARANNATLLGGSLYVEGAEAKVSNVTFFENVVTGGRCVTRLCLLMKFLRCLHVFLDGSPLSTTVYLL